MAAALQARGQRDAGGRRHAARRSGVPAPHRQARDALPRRVDVEHAQPRGGAARPRPRPGELDPEARRDRALPGDHRAHDGRARSWRHGLADLARNRHEAPRAVDRLGVQLSACHDDLRRIERSAAQHHRQGRARPARWPARRRHHELRSERRAGDDRRCGAEVRLERLARRTLPQAARPRDRLGEVGVGRHGRVRLARRRGARRAGRLRRQLRRRRTDPRAARSRPRARAVHRVGGAGRRAAHEVRQRRPAHGATSGR